MIHLTAPGLLQAESGSAMPMPLRAEEITASGPAATAERHELRREGTVGSASVSRRAGDHNGEKGGERQLARAGKNSSFYDILL